eukprot:283388_1
MALTRTKSNRCRMVTTLCYLPLLCGLTLSAPTLYPFVANTTMIPITTDPFTSGIITNNAHKATLIQTIWENITKGIYLYILISALALATMICCIVICVVLRRRDKGRQRGRSEPPKPFNFEMVLTGHSLSGRTKHSLKIIRVSSTENHSITQSPPRSREHRGHGYVGTNTEDPDMYTQREMEEIELNHSETTQLKQNNRMERYAWIIQTLYSIAPNDAEECLQLFIENMVTDERLKELSWQDWNDLLPMIGIRNDFLKRYEKEHPPGQGETSRYSSAN